MTLAVTIACILGAFVLGVALGVRWVLYCTRQATRITTELIHQAIIDVVGEEHDEAISHRLNELSQKTIWIIEEGDLPEE